MLALDIRPCRLDAKTQALRAEVRTFLAEELKHYSVSYTHLTLPTKA